MALARLVTLPAAGAAGALAGRVADLGSGGVIAVAAVLFRPYTLIT